MPAQVGIPHDVRAFLEGVRWATISTTNPDGTPHQAVIWYLVDGDKVLVNSRRGRQWPRNLERDGRASLAIQDWSEPEHWVGLRGVARVVRTGESAVRDIEAMARRYGGNPDDFRGQDRITFEISVDRAFEYGS
jgi:PPOX class probable F420-dependent enzyme